MLHCFVVVYSSHMNTNVLNYAVVIEPDTQTGSDKPGYSAFCPVLGIADDGDTIDEALANIKKTIVFHLECLKEEGQEIPSSSPAGTIVTSVQIAFSADLNFPSVHA